MRPISFGITVLAIVLGPLAYWASGFVTMSAPTATPHVEIEEDESLETAGTCTNAMDITAVRMKCRDQNSDPGPEEFDGDLGAAAGVWGGPVTPSGLWDHISDNYVAHVHLDTATASAIFKVVEDTGPGP